LTEKKNTEQKL